MSIRPTPKACGLSGIITVRMSFAANSPRPPGGTITPGSMRSTPCISFGLTSEYVSRPSASFGYFHSAYTVGKSSSSYSKNTGLPPATW